MRIWAEIFDPLGNRLGDGQLNHLVNASAKRVIDGAGSISFTIPANDERALTLTANERRVRVYANQEEITRLLGSGIIQKRRVSESTSNKQLTISGQSALQELARQSVLIGRKYDNLPLATVVSDLVGLVPGWSAVVDSGLGNVSSRFDGVSVLKALVTLAKQNGLHLREGLTDKTLEFGALGTHTGIRAYGPVSTARGIALNPLALMIDSISVEDNTEDVYNWILPLGAGEGEAALTLEKTTRNSPYTVQTMTLPNGRTGYYLVNLASVAEFGEIRRVLKFSNISALENSDSAIERAANALYDAAAADLTRSSVKQVVYSLSCLKPRSTLRAGDKITVTYKGVVPTSSGELTYIDVNEDFWILEIGESVGAEGVKISLKVSTVDQIQKDAVEVVVGALEEIETRKTSIQSYPVATKPIYVRQMDDTHSAIVPIRLTDATLFLVRCKVWVRTRPFRATAKAASAGGGSTSSGGGSHNHRVAQGGSYIGIAPSASEYRQFLFRNSDNGPSYAVTLPTPTAVDLWTEGSSSEHTHTLPTHTHQLQYGISDDSATPNTVRISLNGVDMTESKGGPWQVGGGSGLFSFSLTDEIIAATGGLRQEHQLEIACDSGQGEVEVVIETIEIIQALAVS